MKKIFILNIAFLNLSAFAIDGYPIKCLYSKKAISKSVPCVQFDSKRPENINSVCIFKNGSWKHGNWKESIGDIAPRKVTICDEGVEYLNKDAEDIAQGPKKFNKIKLKKDEKYKGLDNGSAEGLANICYRVHSQKTGVSDTPVDCIDNPESPNYCELRLLPGSGDHYLTNVKRYINYWYVQYPYGKMSGKYKNGIYANQNKFVVCDGGATLFSKDMTGPAEAVKNLNIKKAIVDQKKLDLAIALKKSKPDQDALIKVNKEFDIAKNNLDILFDISVTEAENSNEVCAEQSTPKAIKTCNTNLKKLTNSYQDATINRDKRQADFDNKHKALIEKLEREVEKAESDLASLKGDSVKT